MFGQCLGLYKPRYARIPGLVDPGDTIGTNERENGFFNARRSQPARDMSGVESGLMLCHEPNAGDAKRGWFEWRQKNHRKRTPLQESHRQNRRNPDCAAGVTSAKCSVRRIKARLMNPFLRKCSNF